MTSTISSAKPIDPSVKTLSDLLTPYLNQQLEQDLVDNVLSICQQIKQTSSISDKDQKTADIVSHTLSSLKTLHSSHHISACYVPRDLILITECIKHLSIHAEKTPLTNGNFGDVHRVQDKDFSYITKKHTTTKRTCSNETCS